MTTVQKPSGDALRKPSTGSKPSVGSRPSQAELHAMGKSLREKCPRSAHAVWKAPDDRDPLRLLELSNEGRIPHLIPIRHGRMVHTPFTFYRGAALSMAADLAVTPASGLRVQACGDRATFSTSAILRRPNDGSSSTSTTWMRPFPLPGSGT